MARIISARIFFYFGKNLETLTALIERENTNLDEIPTYLHTYRVKVSSASSFAHNRSIKLYLVVVVEVVVGKLFKNPNLKF